jgi:hypothetical protein
MSDLELVDWGRSARGAATEAVTIVGTRDSRGGAEPAAVGTARVLLLGDMSEATRTALRWAERLASDGASIDVFYLWSASGDVASADRVEAELAILSNEPSGIDLLSHLGALHRRGVVTVAGCITREAQGGASLATLATRGGYRLVLLGLRRTPGQFHRFRLHGFPCVSGAR